MSRKNIIVATDDPLSPVRGGGALRTLKTAEGFRTRGFDVTLIAPAYRELDLPGIRVLRLLPPEKYFSQVLSTVRFNINVFLRYILLIWECDLVFIHNTLAALTIPVFRFFSGFRFILDLTDIYSEYYCFTEKGKLSRILGPAFMRFEYYVIRQADLVIAATEAMKRLLIQKGVSEEKVVVIYDGAEYPGKGISKRDGYERNVIHLGTVDRQHGVENLVKAIPGVIKYHKDTFFYFVGGGRELRNLKKLCEDTGVLRHCVFTGYIPYKKAVAYLGKAGVGVITRPLCLSNNIVTTLKLFEYWASGVAVISSPLEGIREVAEEGVNIVYFRDSDPCDLAAKITLILEEKDFSRRIREGGIETARKYVWGRQVELIIESSL